MAYLEFNILAGKRLSDIKTVSDYQNIITEIHYYCYDGTIYKQFHNQDCCEIVFVQDINGDLKDLIGPPILIAEEIINKTNHPENIDTTLYGNDSFTWTFYKLATIKGYVTIRWYGEYSGYYSEDVNLIQFNLEN